MSLTLYEKYETGDTTETTQSIPTAGTFENAQTFTPSVSHSLKKVELKLLREGTIGDVTVEIRATTAGLPDGTNAVYGSALASKATDCSAVTTGAAGEWVAFVFAAPVNLTASTVYAICVACDTYDVDNNIKWRTDTSGAYTGGQWCEWGAGPAWVGSNYDFIFREYGGPTIAGSPPSAADYTKKLVAVGADEVWYESSTGTMAVLGASVGDLDVTENLMMCEAFQKIFIANKTNKKVIDFINTKITTTDILPAGVIPLKGDILEATGGADSGAIMIVDYIDASDGACNVYGYRTSTATFVDTDVVTGSNDNGDISFTLNADEVAPAPHWYNWTVYSADATTYGTMPTQPTITCLYRGRLFLSGDSTKPHQWWLTKVNNPWSVKYDSTDQLSGVSGGDSDVGEIGDIVTAAIPYKDDLLVIGCANSVWVMIGDPTAGGQLAEVSLATGIWGARAWCIDDKGNLYFLGNDGLYRVPLGIGMPPPENISRLNLPNLISDLDLDKSLHRVVLSYDPFNYGIIICRTLLTSGANTSYWFDLTTQGFYPESYPNSCGIFSAFHYQATDDTYNKFLVGGADGYIREFDDSTENDATTSSTIAINSYCTILQKIAEDSEKEAKLTSLTAITAGGGSGGDTDSVTWSLYKGKNAEEVLNNITSGATAFATGSWTTVGKQNRIRQRLRGAWIGIKLSDNTASKTWALERLFGNIEPAGKI